MKRLSNTIVCLLVLACTTASAQYASLKRATQSFERLAYEDAARQYEKAVKQGANEIEVARNLAISYRKLRDFKNAEKWYAKMILAKDAKPEDLYNFSEVLRSNAKYAESEFWLEEYREVSESDSRVARQKNALAYLEDIWFEPILNCRVKGIQQNTKFADMGPTLRDGKVYFASSRSTNALVERTHSWNDMPFMDLYVADTALYGELENVQELEGPFNTRYHESNVSFDKEGTRMYFTRNNFFEGKAGRNKKGVNNLKIYYAEYVEGSWQKEKSFKYNSDEYSVGHPSVSSKGDRLFFTSNMPGGYGATDIYVCKMLEDGSWGEPTNLGPNVNTEGTEMFPLVYGDGTLYFASDGHKGLGGLDIHAVRIPYDRPGFVENLGAPVNSGYDDFGLVLNEEGTRGYFASNREPGIGDDDIYTFVLKDPMRFDMTLTGRVTLGYSGPIQSNIPVKLLDRDGALIYSTVTDDLGNFEFAIDKGMDYSLVTGPANAEILLEFDTHDIESVPFTVDMDVVIPPLTGVTLWALIKDMRTGRHLSDVDVRLIDKSDGEELFRGVTDAAGNARKSFPEALIDDELSYTVELDKLGYLPRSFDVKLKVNEFGEVPLHELLGDMFYLVPSDIGVDLGHAMALNPIYFDHNKSAITPEAMAELDKVVLVLKNFPEMIIECGSHTSSSGTNSYNKKLSQRRASSTRKYLMSKGVSAKRLKAKGYGETVLVNECADGIECSDERHAYNRRTEFVILDM